MMPVHEGSDVQQLRLSICDAADFREAAELVQTAVMQLYGVDAVAIFAFDSNGDFHLVSYAGVSDEASVGPFRHFSRTSPQAILVMRGEPIYRTVSKLTADRAELYQREGLQSIAVYPIVQKGSVVGSLHIGSRSLTEIPRELGAQLEVFTQSLGNAIARITYEAMLHRAYAEVESKVRERTRDLQIALDALRESEGKFRLLAEHSHVAVGILRDDHLLYANPYLSELTGYAPDELARLDCRDLLPEDQRELAHTRVQLRLSGVTMSRAYEYPLITKSGHVCWVEVTPVLIDYQGAPAIMGMAMDITERKQMESALRASETHFRQLADLIPQIVWTAHADGTMEYINAQWSKYTGNAPEKFSDACWPEVVHPDDRLAFVEDWRECVRKGASQWEREVRVQHHSGGYRWNLARAVSVRNAGGQITHWLGTCTDINDQKLTETALRTAHRRKDEFLAVLGHELRNPLGPLRNAAQILKHIDSPDATLNRSQQIIDRQVTQMARLIDDLLDVTRISRGKIGLQKEPTDLTAMLQTHAQDFKTICDGAGLNLFMYVPHEAVWVNGDAARLQQVLGNLLNNAVKFTDAGGAIHISLNGTSPEEAVLSVEDTGIGIEPDKLDQIFTRYEQADRTLHRSLGGLGLGLALVKGLVELHGGTVSAASPGPGKGSTFTVRLPRLNAPQGS